MSYPEDLDPMLKEAGRRWGSLISEATRQNGVSLNELCAGTNYNCDGVVAYTVEPLETDSDGNAETTLSCRECLADVVDSLSDRTGYPAIVSQHA